ncbi:folylpolyglutamate synthase/dihydrofolate synthase family protein [Oceanobacter sp. 3_MG-2023]|uniref:bifunctional folylpolyglutamate synthase/dihydrofolate synthase n=1 Tax=Oceanobacter sp. 3_MG-2023 TaxID=3062622 RepID=UPI002732A91F|nr:folylpolyglutamate synthase/dihydrofolate synthase family protein [Oceanobacter sp. 3_MG-2023]MDP2507065.1 folylpolyglutamate synthase/dihydrofolate synthase family protein [Oceanobacter sp. 3_MG-2023]
MADFSSWNVKRWLEHLESVHPAEIDMGLDRVRTVAERLGCLHPAGLVILVAGTNGKGTTSALMSALLSRQGFSVGCYNSPHILRYNERVSVNGNDISDADLCQSFALVEQARQGIALTYFEFGTLAALAWFKQQNLDACVLEIGLGGRLDAVNVVDADLSVVTSIGLDHEAWLGNDLDVIAYEKCSIVRPDRYLVCGQPMPPGRARTTVEAVEGLWLGRGEAFDITECVQGGEAVLNLRFLPCPDEDTSMSWVLPRGFIPAANIATAVQALAAVGHLMPEVEVVKTLKRLRVPGRLQGWQCLCPDGRQLRLTLDVAHNEQAAAYLATREQEVDGILLAMLADKPVEAVVQALPDTTQWTLAGLDCPRGLDVARLALRFHTVVTQGSGVEVTACTRVRDALEHWQQTATADEHWLVVGSFYTVEQALTYIHAQQKSGEYVWKSI